MFNFWVWEKDVVSIHRKLQKYPFGVVCSVVLFMTLLVVTYLHTMKIMFNYSWKNPKPMGSGLAWKAVPKLKVSILREFSLSFSTETFEVCLTNHLFGIILIFIKQIICLWQIIWCWGFCTMVLLFCRLSIAIFLFFTTDSDGFKLIAWSKLANSN